MMESIAYEALLKRDGKVITHVVGNSMRPLLFDRASIVVVAFIWENVASAVREGTPLYVPGVQGWAAVEFANAITLSHFTNSTVKFPVDRKAYDALLQELKQGKKGLI